MSAPQPQSAEDLGNLVSRFARFTFRCPERHIWRYRGPGSEAVQLLARDRRVEGDGGWWGFCSVYSERLRGPTFQFLLSFLSFPLLPLPHLFPLRQ